MASRKTHVSGTLKSSMLTGLNKSQLKEQKLFVKFLILENEFLTLIEGMFSNMEYNGIIPGVLNPFLFSKIPTSLYSNVS